MGAIVHHAPGAGRPSSARRGALGAGHDVATHAAPARLLATFITFGSGMTQDNSAVLKEIAPAGALRVGVAVGPSPSPMWATKDAAGKPVDSARTRANAFARRYGRRRIILPANAGGCSLGRKENAMAVTCCIRYVLDPFKLDGFAEYAKRWRAIVPRCGGDFIGYFLPHESTNNIALALVTFESLAAYEAYRVKIRSDADGVANFKFAQERRFILSEERTFLQPV
jgi:hypothetical protein